MSLKSHPSGAVGVPDRSEYAAQFRCHCHQLIAFGYNGIRAEDHGGSEEDFITQRIKESIQAATNAETLPPWASRYFLTDQVPIGVPGLVGKKRPKIDIEVQSAEAHPRAVYHFEAKRLRAGDSKSVSAYVGKDGLGMFLAERYGRMGDEGGMLGYVQSESPTPWAEKIGSKLCPDPSCKYRLTADGTWARAPLITELGHTYATRHTRPTLCDITIYHTLLDFCNDTAAG